MCGAALGEDAENRETGLIKTMVEEELKFAMGGSALSIHFYLIWVRDLLLHIH